MPNDPLLVVVALKIPLNQPEPPLQCSLVKDCLHQNVFRMVLHEKSSGIIGRQNIGVLKLIWIELLGWHTKLSPCLLI